MGGYEFEVEKYVVKYGAFEHGTFYEEIFYSGDKAVKFAKEKSNKGLIVKIEQISRLVGWC